MSYHSIQNCKGCPKRCFSASEKKKTFRRHIHPYLREENTIRRLSAEGKAIDKRRKETVERSFADAKQNHGLRWILYRGLKKNQKDNWLLCAAQNLKKLGRLKSKDYVRQMNDENSSIIEMITTLFKRMALIFFDITKKTVN